MLDALIKKIEEKHAKAGAAAVNKLLAAKNIILAIDPDLLKSEVIPITPPTPIPEPPPAAASSKKKTASRKKA